MWPFDRFRRRGGYDSGGWRRGGNNWIPVDGRAEEINSMSRDMLRSRARDLERNGDHVEAMIQAMQRNVVGGGIQVNHNLGDDLLEQQAESLWKGWCHAKSCDARGELCFHEIQSMAVRRMLVDGGLLIVRVTPRQQQGFSRVPLQLQLREVDELCTSITFCGGNKVVGGVELDGAGRPVAYHFLEYGLFGESGRSQRVPADRVIYLHKSKRPCEVREVSLLANIIGRLRDLNQYLNAISVKERMLACIGIVFKKANQLGGFGRNAARDPDTGAVERKMSPGMILETDPGDGVEVVNPTGQAVNAKEMVSTLLRSSSSAMGLSYEVVSRDMSQSNYSSARQNLLEDRETYREWQHYLMEHLCLTVYQWFLDSCVVANLLPIPDYFTRRSWYLSQVSTLAKGVSWIDPVKEVNANKIALQTGQTTLQEIAAERGKDWREILKQRKKEQDFVKQIGLEDENNGN